MAGIDTSCNSDMILKFKKKKKTRELKQSMKNESVPNIEYNFFKIKVFQNSS